MTATTEKLTRYGFTSSQAQVLEEMFTPIQTYVWATRPNYSLVEAGTVIMVSDIGGEAGSFWSATATGWVPLNGRVVVAQAYGSVATPLDTQTGSTGTAFAVGDILIPANSLIVGKSALVAEALIMRRGATATAVFTATLGTANTVADSSIVNMSLAATNNLAGRPHTRSVFPDATTMTVSNMASPGTSSATGVLVDRATNINTAADMYIGFNMNTGNAADSYDLINYSIAIEAV